MSYLLILRNKIRVELKNSTFVKIFYLLFISTFLNANNIVLTNISEYKIDEENIKYKIEAKSKIINYKKLKKFRFYNKEKLISNSSFYINGNFSTRQLNLDFKKAYFLEGNFIMHNIKGTFKNRPIKAKKSTFSKTNIFLENVFITIKNKKYKKLKYNLSLN